MTGGVSAYAAISARTRVLYSDLLDGSELAALAEAADLATLVALLKRTPYRSGLLELKERDLTLPPLIAIIKGRLAASYRSLILGTPAPARRTLMQLYRQYEVDNLKAVLRGIAIGRDLEGAGSLWDRIRAFLFPMGAGTVVPAEQMAETGNVPAAIELLRGTQYFPALSLALKRYSAEQSLFPLEVALDLHYWRRLWQEAQKLSGQDQAQALRIIGSLVDMNNLMWAIRYRVYHQLSEEELINYTLPFGHRVRDEDIRAIAAGGDMGAVVARLYPDVPAARDLLEEPKKGLPVLEHELTRFVAKRCLAAFLGDPFHVGLPLGYLVMHDLEVHDLTLLLEAKSSGISVQEFQPYLLKGSVVGV